MVTPTGVIKILRSRAASDAAWNCSDGAALDDDEANNPDLWAAYTPEELAAQLKLARHMTQLAGCDELSSGLATWSSCSGKPCALPRLAKLFS